MTCSAYDLTLRYEGRNNRGMRVLAARCSCAWVHMTAYPLFRKRRAKGYLRRRFTDHLYESWARGPSTRLVLDSQPPSRADDTPDLPSRASEDSAPYQPSGDA